MNVISTSGLNRGRGSRKLVCVDFGVPVALACCSQRRNLQADPPGSLLVGCQKSGVVSPRGAIVERGEDVNEWLFFQVYRRFIGQPCGIESLWCTDIDVLWVCIRVPVSTVPDPLLYGAQEPASEGPWSVQYPRIRSMVVAGCKKAALKSPAACTVMDSASAVKWMIREVMGQAEARLHRLEAVARELGVSRRTVRLWSHRPSFPEHVSTSAVGIWARVRGLLSPDTSRPISLDE